MSFSCCPGITCHVSINPNNSNDDEQVPILHQPRSVRGRSMRFLNGDDNPLGNLISTSIEAATSSTIMGIINSAGELVSGLLNSSRVQRSAGYVQQSMTPYCTKHCPPFIRHFFHCCCACIINETETDQQSTNEDSDPSLLQSLVNEFGPITMGMFLKNNPSLQEVILSNEPLSDDLLNAIHSGCRETNVNLDKVLNGCIRDSLQEFVWNPNNLPAESSQFVKCLMKGYRASLEGNNSNISCYITHKTDTQTEDAAAAVATAGPITSTGNEVARLLSWDNLERQLSRIFITDFCSRLHGNPSQDIIEDVIKVLKNTLSFLVKQAPGFESGELALTITSHQMMELIVLSFAAHNFAITNEEGTNPPTVEDLHALAKLIQESSDDISRINSPFRSSSSSSSISSGEDVVDSHRRRRSLTPNHSSLTLATPEYQRRMLAMASRVHNASGLFG